MNQTTGRKSHTAVRGNFLVRYRELADAHDVLPTDAILRSLMGGCGDSTLSGIRSRLTHEEGYEFERTKTGYRVLRRPSSKPAPFMPEPQQPLLVVEPPAPIVPPTNGTAPNLPVGDDRLLNEARDVHWVGKQTLTQLVALNHKMDLMLKAWGVDIANPLDQPA